jgi:hypothetical protein
MHRSIEAPIQMALDDDDEWISLKALAVAWWVGLITAFGATPFFYGRAVADYINANNIKKIEKKGFFNNYLDFPDVNLSQLGISIVIIEIIIPSILFFIIYIILARASFEFCRLSANIFERVSSGGDAFMPEGGMIFVIRVVLWPLFILYGMFLLLASMVVLFFRGVFR